MNNPRWNQAAAQGFNDGTESGSTSKGGVGPPDGTFSQNVDETFLYRILIQETNTADANNTAISHKLQSNNGGAGWVDVTTTTNSSGVKIVNSSNLTHGADTTQRIGSNPDYVDDNNWVADTSGTTNASSASEAFSNNESEALWAVQFDSAVVSNGQTIQFRAVEANGTAFFSYAAGSSFNITVVEAVTDVFIENRHAIEQGIKPLTAAGMSGVLVE